MNRKRIIELIEYAIFHRDRCAEYEEYITRIVENEVYGKELSEEERKAKEYLLQCRVCSRRIEEMKTMLTAGEKGDLEEKDNIDVEKYISMMKSEKKGLFNNWRMVLVFICIMLIIVVGVYIYRVYYFNDTGKFNYSRLDKADINKFRKALAEIEDKMPVEESYGFSGAYRLMLFNTPYDIGLLSGYVRDLIAMGETEKAKEKLKLIDTNLNLNLEELFNKLFKDSPLCFIFADEKDQNGCQKGVDAYKVARDLLLNKEVDKTKLKENSDRLKEEYKPRIEFFPSVYKDKIIQNKELEENDFKGIIFFRLTF